MAAEGGLTSEAIDRILETFKVDSLKELQRRGLEALIKDVRAHCYCASLVRTLFIGHARATSFSSARTESKT